MITMPSCDVCGARLLHYENPDRDICPREADHAKMHVGKPQVHSRPVTGRRGKKDKDEKGK